MSDDTHFDAVVIGSGHRAVYLPGNHDAEVWWNPDIQRTLSDAGLVDAFALSHAVRYASAPAHVIYMRTRQPVRRRQHDPRLHRSAGHPAGRSHRDRPDAPAGRISRNLDLGDVGRVYPLVTVPDWIAGRIFYDLYDLLARIATRLLLPLLLGYAAYRLVASGLAVASEGSERFSVWDSYRTLPGVQTLFAEIAWDALLLVTVFILFFLASRRVAVQTVSAVTSRMPGEPANAFGLGSPVERIRHLLASDEHPPMHGDLTGREIRVFVSGHTHAPALSRLVRGDGEDAIVVNSGCWLRQMRPVAAHFGGPPVFVSRFVHTHVRVALDGGRIRVELREHPKPASSHLPLAERLAILGRVPEQPASGAAPRLIASATVAVE